VTPLKRRHGVSTAFQLSDAVGMPLERRQTPSRRSNGVSTFGTPIYAKLRRKPPDYADCTLVEGPNQMMKCLHFEPNDEISAISLALLRNVPLIKLLKV
jgi:hypothetical protein